MGRRALTLAGALFASVEADAQVLTLSCDGTVRVPMVGADNKPEKVTRQGVVVNLNERTVTALGVTSQITNVDAVSVSFTGRTGEFLSVHGTLNRIAGHFSASIIWVNQRGELISRTEVELSCKPTRPRF